MIAIALRSLAAAGLAILIVAPLGALVGHALARRRIPLKPALDTLVSLPLALPPVAVGIALLWMVSPRYSPLGRFLTDVGAPVVFSFGGVVLCAAVMSFPLMARAAEAAFAGVPREAEEAARNLGAGRLRVVATVTTPMAARGLAAGVLLAFARALGEFGATMVVAGYRPGVTDTLALAIYFSAENPRRQDDVPGLMAIAIGLCFLAALASRLALGKRRGAAA